MGARYIIRFDDVAPAMAWGKFLPLKQFMEQLEVRCLLGVVPDCRDPVLEVETKRSDFFDLVRSWKSFGDTIAQHGTHHIYETSDAGLLGIHPRSEFAGLPYDIQLARIQQGRAMLESEGVWAPVFMPPSHSFDLNTVMALKALGFRAITDGVGFFPYMISGLKLVPQLLGRPFAFGFGVITICVHVNSIEQQDIEQLKRFVIKRRKQFVSFDEVLGEPVYQSFWAAFLRVVTAYLLKLLRSIRKGSLGDLS
jgi:predicted deacetylase